MDAPTYLRAYADAWMADPDRFDFLMETGTDIRNMLRDLASRIESGSYDLNP